MERQSEITKTSVRKADVAAEISTKDLMNASPWSPYYPILREIIG
jgi:hypothetical protein